MQFFDPHDVVEGATMDPVDDAALIDGRHGDVHACREKPHVFGVMHVKALLIGEVNAEWPERFGMESFENVTHVH